MRIALVASALVLLASASQAGGIVGYGAMVQRQTPTCLKPMPRQSRVAFLGAQPGPCCDSMASCSQLLATTKIDLPRAPSHT